MVWVKKKLLLKGEEKAAGADLWEAQAELLHKMNEAWVEGTVRVGANVRRPCVVAYAAAGCLVQVGGKEGGKMEGGRPGCLRAGTGQQRPHHYLFFVSHVRGWFGSRWLSSMANPHPCRRR